MKLKILLYFMFLVFLLSAENYVPGQLLLQLDEVKQEQSFSIEQIQQDLPHLKISNARLLSERLGVWVIDFDNSRTKSGSAINDLNSHSMVRISQVNHYVEERQTIPDDPFFGNQWALDNTGQTGGVPDADIDAPEAWDFCTGGVTALGDTIILAIIDSGNYLEHEDLNFWKNNAEIPNNAIDDDNNGYVDDYDGWNAVSHNGNVSNSSHGTHVSGIAGAIGNNGLGVAGVNWGAKIMPIRGSSSTESIVVEAYGYVLEMRSLYNETNGAEGAFVVATNASFGVNYGDPEDFPIWSAMYDSLGMQGVLSCGATMNINANVDQLGDMPTACDSDYLISVTNTTDDDVKNSGAAYGLTTIDLGAPGTSVYSTDLSNTYSYKTGTSMACPQVTGAIGFLFSAAPETFIQSYMAEPAEYALLIKQYILAGTDSLEALNGITVTGGRLNIFNSLQYFEQVPEPQWFEVSGIIDSDTTWVADTVHVVGDVWIDGGATVTIPAGTRIQFEGYYNIDVQGAVIAEGTESDSILFTVADTTGFSSPYLSDGSWNGFLMNDINSGVRSSQFSYCIFEYAKGIEDFVPVEGACFRVLNVSELNFTNCTFRNNYAGSGGAIYTEDSELTVVGSLFEDNLAAFSGGAICLTGNSIAHISGSVCRNNLALQGGAIYTTTSSLELVENIFDSNQTRPGQVSAGGALYLWESNTNILNNNFTANFTPGQGGAIHIENNDQNSHFITKNIFDGNYSGLAGGSIDILNNSNAKIINNLIVNSHSSQGGAILLSWADSVKFYNNTIADNSSNSGAGMACYNYSSVDLINNIFWNNEATVEGDQLDLSECTIDISYNNFEEGMEGITIGNEVQYIFENNIDADPYFLMEGEDPYNISIESSCINLGTPDTTGLEIPDLDLAGNPRIFEGFVTNIDIGAYEFQGDNVNSDEDEIANREIPRILSIHPNPFNPTTTISFVLNENDYEGTDLSIYNLKGQKIRTLAISHSQLISRMVTWDGTDDLGNSVTSGIYFSKLTTKDHSSFRKMILLK